jgi:hypothetical protein
MFRSILKGSFLAASLCVLAMSSNAHARSHLSSSGDVNLPETSGGQKWAAEKKAGATCPDAVKVDRYASTAPAKTSAAAVSAGGFSGGQTTVY